MEYKQATLVNWRNEDEDEEKKQQTHTRSEFISWQTDHEPYGLFCHRFIIIMDGKVSET